MVYARKSTKPKYSRQSATLRTPRRAGSRATYTIAPSPARPAMRRAVTREHQAVKEEMSALDTLLKQTGVENLQPEAVGGGLKPITVCKQRYHERITLGDGLLVPYFYAFRLNSTFDPNETGTGHQPFGRDAMAGQYNDYIVIGASWKVSFKNIGEVTAVSCWAYPSTDAALSVQTYTQAKECSPKMVKTVQLRGSTEQLESEWGEVSGQIDPRDFMQIKQSYEENFSAGVGANPATPIRLHIGVSDIVDAAIGANTVLADVTIIYDVAYKTPVTSQFS